MNPFDLDFSPWTGEELRSFRKSLWVTPRESRSHPKFPRSYPSSSDMAARVGVSQEQWRVWEREGVPSNGWSALLRIYRDEERRDIQPINCAIEALDGIMLLVGDYTALSQALEVDRRTITKWRYEIGYVPGVQGYGRVVRICYVDMVLMEDETEKAESCSLRI